MNKFRLLIYKKSMYFDDCEMYDEILGHIIDDFEMYDEILGHDTYKRINAVWHRLIANEYKRL